MKIKHIVPLAVLGLLTLNSCKKENSELKSENQPTSFKPAQFPSNEAERQKVASIISYTNIIKTIFKKYPNAAQEVASLCKSKYYHDTYVFINDLMDEQSKIYQSSKLNQSVKGSFKSAFLEIWAIENSMGSNFGNLPNFGDLNIYFPYADKFSSLEALNYTITPADRDADEGIGYITKDAIETTVVVNDDYASTYPTLIVGVTSTDATSWNGNLANTNPESIWTTTPPQNLPAPPPPPPLNPPANELRKSYIGMSKCTKQYDALISFTGNGGGSEIKYTRTDGYLKVVEQQVTDLADVISVDHSRSEIRDGVVKEIVAAWDTDWESDNKEQYFAIYEEDNKGTISWSGKLSTKVKVLGVPLEAEIGFSISRQSQDAIIRQFKITYRSYFLDGRNDQGHGFVLLRRIISIPKKYFYDYSFLTLNECPWPAYDWSSGVGFTWPYKRVF